MFSSLKQFHIDMYREHLESASFIHDQRQAYLHDPELDWPDLVEWEDRMEAHLDALVLGGGLALEVCRRQAVAGDAGEAHAALRVLCRQGRKDYAFGVLSTLDLEDEEVLRATAQALAADAPPAWQSDLLRILQGNQPHLTALLASVAGYRRFGAADVIERKLASRPEVGVARMAWALGRLGSDTAAPLLWPLLDHEDEAVCEAAAIALLRLGDERPLQRALLSAQIHAWPRRVIAIAGDSRAVNVLLDAVKGKSADQACVLGLGLLGDLAAVAPLVTLLDHEELGDSAAIALNTITGAALFKEVFVADDIDVDEMFDDERARYEKDGTLPTRADGEPYGTWERRPLRDAEHWRAWLAENRGRFAREYRWRLGQPYGPQALLATLQSPTCPYAVRAAAYEELVIRYAMDAPFEVDLQVRQQQRVLQRVAQWVSGNAKAFTAGRWYCHGRPQT